MPPEQFLGERLGPAIFGLVLALVFYFTTTSRGKLERGVS
jgi:hypothetical protein